MNSNRDDISIIGSDIHISLDSLSKYPELLVKLQSGDKLSLNNDEYSALMECSCRPEYDRTIINWDRFKKTGDVNFPSGFKSPIDFFEATTSLYVAKYFHHLPEIHIMSMGSGQLLRELIVISKLVHAMKERYHSTPKIILHAIDYLYKKENRSSNDYFLKASSSLCIEQFKKVIEGWDENISLCTYSSLEKFYDKRISRESIYPEVILSIDLSVPFDIDFPEENKNMPSRDIKHTQQGILTNYKNFLPHNSVSITMTHEVNEGIFIIVERKENTEWQKEWIHTISSKKFIEITPCETIQNIIDEHNHRFEMTENYKKEILEKDRFKNASLSRLVKEKYYLVFDDDECSGKQKELIETIDSLVKTGDVNAQCQEGFTALHWAAMARDEKMIKKLIFHGADPNIKNNYSRTPIDYYEYQICLSDFKDNFTNIEHYNLLLSDYSDSDLAYMPEFCQLYIEDDDKSFALDFRNKEEIDLSIFNGENNINTKMPVPKLSQTQIGIFKPAIEQSNSSSCLSSQYRY